MKKKYIIKSNDIINILNHGKLKGQENKDGSISILKEIEDKKFILLAKLKSTR